MPRTAFPKNTFGGLLLFSVVLKCTSNIAVTWKYSVVNRMNMEFFRWETCPIGNPTKLTFPVQSYLFRFFQMFTYSIHVPSPSSINFIFCDTWANFHQKDKPMEMKYSASYFSIASILLTFWITSKKEPAQAYWRLSRSF